MEGIELSQVIPNEILIEIAKCNWRAYGIIKVCNRELYEKLITLDPYELFTWRHLEDHEIGVTTHWITDDRVHIRCIDVMIGGFMDITLRHKKHLKFDYGSIPWMDEYDQIHMGEFTYDIKKYNYDGTKTLEQVTSEEWYIRREPYYKLVR
jgi:hypothetical protein